MDSADTLTGSHPLRVGFEARDFDTAASALAPDVVLHSPITSLFRFEGRDEVTSLLREVRAVFDELEYLHDFGDRNVRVLVFAASVGGLRIQGTDIMANRLL